MSEATSVLLFAYGTLQDPAVQQANFGRHLEGAPDELPGFEAALVEIADPEVVAESGRTHHPIVRPNAGAAEAVQGTVFRISPAELKAADDYEVDDYRRVSVRLASGLHAWVYVAAEALLPTDGGLSV